MQHWRFKASVCTMARRWTKYMLQKFGMFAVTVAYSLIIPQPRHHCYLLVHPALWICLRQGTHVLGKVLVSKILGTHVNTEKTRGMCHCSVRQVSCTMRRGGICPRWRYLTLWNVIFLLSVCIVWVFIHENGDSVYQSSKGDITSKNLIFCF